MALSDPSQAITTSLNDISYTAGQEPWNKNLNQYSFESKDTEVNNYIPDWSKWHGIYRTIPEARSTIDTWVNWVVGKELIMDAKTKKIVDRIEGNGKTTIRKILKNVLRGSNICGDGFADINKSIWIYMSCRFVNVDDLREIIGLSNVNIRVIENYYLDITTRGSYSFSIKVRGSKSFILKEIKS